MTQDEFFSTFRSAAIFIGGAATVMGVNSLSAVDLQTDLDHMINGAKEFMLGAGPLIGLGMAYWAKFRASPGSQKAAVAAQPNMIVVETTSPVTAANAIAEIPQVKQIIAKQSVADAAPSDKVVSK